MVVIVFIVTITETSNTTVCFQQSRLSKASLQPWYNYCSKSEYTSECSKSQLFQNNFCPFCRGAQQQFLRWNASEPEVVGFVFSSWPPIFTKGCLLSSHSELVSLVPSLSPNREEPTRSKGDPHRTWCFWCTIAFPSNRVLNASQLHYQALSFLHAQFSNLGTARHHLSLSGSGTCQSGHRRLLTSLVVNCVTRSGVSPFWCRRTHQLGKLQ